MKRLLIAAVIFAFAGCAAYVGPQGTYIEPLIPPIVIGPPMVVAPPPGVIVSPLPPVYIVPGGSLYYYDNFYYYSWQGGWYWSRHQKGPWHDLPRDRWPSRMENRGRGHERGEHGERERDYR